MEISGEETKSEERSYRAGETGTEDLPDATGPGPIPIPPSSHALTFSTQNVIDYTSGLTSPAPVKVGGASSLAGLRGPSLPTSPGSSSGLDFGSPMALNSPLSRSYGPVPVWAEDSVTFKPSCVAFRDGGNDIGDEAVGPRGLAGLGNLGNTCFMNSALQCLCHTPQLMYAFLSGEYKHDLNTDNPLGLGGKLATAFGGLLSKLWKPGASFVTPKHFKFMLSKFSPQFSGYSQQDSQELLSFLLDGLHEDLNRIKDKPYKEERDADGRPDEEVALEAWENYRARNDSVVVDTFQGLYKSTLKCPLCGYTSVKFDPFMYLSLPLPSPKRRTFQVTVIDQFCGRASVHLAVQISKSSSIGDLLREVSKMYDEESTRTSQHGMQPDSQVDHQSSESPSILSEWALGRWNGKTMDLFLNEGASVESIPEKPSFVYSYFSSKSYKLYAYRFPVGERGAEGVEDAEDGSDQQIHRRVVPPSAGARPVLVYHRGNALKEQSIPSLYFLPKCGYVELDVAKSEEDNNWEVQPDNSLQHALDALASASPAADRDDSNMLDDVYGAKDIQERNNNKVADPGGMDDGIAAGTSGTTVAVMTSDSPGVAAVDRSSPAFRLLYATSSGQPKATSYFSSSPPSIGSVDDPTTIFLCAKWTEDKGRHVAVVREPVIEHPSVKILERQSSLPFKATLADCLECFCQPEQLDESDTWYCSKCKDHVRAIKKLDLWYLPPVLVIHLKRFSYSRYSRDKLDTHIDFPLEQLDLSGFISRSAHATSKKMKLSNNNDTTALKQDEDPIYDLYAVSNHFGGMGGGHYTAFCQVPDDQGWYDFDDSHVSEVGIGKVQSSAAYVLFYHRRGSDVGLAKKALEVADSVVHDQEAKACDSPIGTPLSPRIFSRPLEAIPSSEMLDMDM